MSSTAYKIFVMQSSEEGQEIEFKHNNKTKGRPCVICPRPDWNWVVYIYSIKLPEGREYVIEDGEIAFRQPKSNEAWIGKDGEIRERNNRKVIYNTIEMSPIIKPSKGNNV